MGVVYLGVAWDGSPVAVKVLRPELAGDAEFRVRFGHEVAALLRVRGVCTVRVIEAASASALPFMVTEYAEGPSLSEYIDACGPLEAGLLAGLAAGLAEALTAIHAAGVVHRDLKPSNVILTSAGPKVIDFGIAQTLGTTSVTKTGMMVGSAGFMAPEQVTGRAGQEADIFAWAVTVAYAASGQPPFGEGEPVAILYRILHGSPDVTAVPATLRPLVMSALSKDPRQRPTAAGLLDLLAGPAIRHDHPAPAVQAATWTAARPRAFQALASRPRASRPRAGQRHEGESVLFEPGAKPPPARRQYTPEPGRWSRWRTLIGGTVATVAGIAALVSGLLMGHVINASQLAANQLAPAGPTTAALGTYPGQRQRGVFQAVNRVLGYGDTIVALGSQASDGVVRPEFSVSSDGGRTWRAAPVHAAQGQVPSGHAATLLAGGPGGWLAIGPEAIWTSRDGISWTLASDHGITPQRPGDAVWVITKTAAGFLAAGTGRAPGGGPQGVIWTSRDGLTWQRMTAAGLGLAAAGEIVPSISYAASHDDSTLIAGTVTAGGATYSGAWLSTDGGAAWTRVSIPVSNGAGNTISGLAADGSGLIAVRPGGTSDGTASGEAYFSPTGLAWQDAGTINASAGWRPGVVKGTDGGFVVTGQTASGRMVAYTSTGTGIAWRPTRSLGHSPDESVTSATLAPDGTVVAVGATRASAIGQRPVFLEATTTGGVRPVSVPGGVVAERWVNATVASPDGVMVAVGSADGYPAAWQGTPGGGWRLVTSESLASAYQGLTSLISVTHGASGWLAVGAPGPVVLASQDGTTWRRAAGGIAEDLGAVSAITTTAGPAGYSIAGRPAGPESASTADVWWSRNLTSWTRAQDMNVTSGSTQVLAVAPEPHGFVSAGSHDERPAVWTTTDGRLWTTIVLAMPVTGEEVSSAVLRQVAVNGDRVVALGQANTANGPVPFAELSADGGASWRQVSFGPPGPGTVVTALTAYRGGFAAAGTYGAPGQQAVVTWTSAGGTTWTSAPVGRLGDGSGVITSLASSGPAVTAFGSVATAQDQRFLLIPLPGH
jgi:hypothetical protein